MEQTGFECGFQTFEVAIPTALEQHSAELAEPCGPEFSPTTWVTDRFQTLIDQGAECATCPWSDVCMGFFKWPDSAYSCAGVKQLFSEIKAAADDIGQDLASREKQSHSATRTTL